MIALKHAGRDCFCWALHSSRSAPELWSLCFRTKCAWIFWHAPEAVFSEQDRNESLGKHHQFNCIYSSLPSLSLPSVLAPPRARLRKYWNDERRLHLSLPLSPHIHHEPVHISCLHARGQSASRAGDEPLMMQSRSHSLLILVLHNPLPYWNIMHHFSFQPHCSVAFWHWHDLHKAKLDLFKMCISYSQHAMQFIYMD